MRYRAEVEEPAFAILRERKASRPGGAAVRKELVTFTCGDADYFHEILDGIEPCLSQVVAGAAPSVTSLSLNNSWPPSHSQRGYPASAFIASCHHSLLVLCIGNCRPGNRDPGFYLVYDARASSVAIVPPLLWCGGVCSRSHCDIAGAASGAAILRLAGTTEERDDGYLLAELLLRIDDRSYLPTNEATLFTWESLGCGGPTTTCRWLQREVVLPLPLPADEDEDDLFCADMVFALGSTSLCWVDLLTGILVTLTTWVLHHRLSPTKFQWHKDASFRIGDLCWDDPAPGDGVIYLSLTDYEYDHQDEVLEATGLYVLSIDMHRRREGEHDLSIPLF
ncbi:hypothetical protein SETIT_4G121600v2 [Setaria italica]|uniref:DUF1618 domain-containing protein n=1 Tax=Setaria italica TaxID=4555 RepID=A0A368QTT0_SETIT|nr:hypothetical protein SETIT_4G121600v2 [Setaria italica]